VINFKTYETENSVSRCS